MGDQISDTAYCRKSLFYTLFTFYYDLMYGIGAMLAKSEPKPVAPRAIQAALSASDLIQNGQFEDEELAKALRGATTHAGSRKTRLEFLQKVLKNDQSELGVSG